MINKAKNNLVAAQRIIDANDASICFASIHCSYYAVFQFMKYLLANLKRGDISYDKQKEICGGADSHDTILSKIRGELPGKNFRKERQLVEDIRLLKNVRVSADYTLEPFSVLDCIEIKQEAEAIIKKLQSLFNDKITRA